MIRTLLVALPTAVVVVVAFAAPAAVVAKPILTAKSNPGIALAKGTTFKATSANTKVTGSAVGTLTCDHIAVNGEVTTNAGGTVSGKSTSAEADSCKYGPLAKAMTVTGFTVSSLTTTESGKGALSLTFVDHIGPVECHFEGSGNFVYSTESDVIHVEGLALTATSPLCGGSNILFSGDFTLTTASGDPLRISAIVSPVLTAKNNPGVPVAKGTTFNATSANTKITGSAVGTLTCDHIAVNGEVTANSGGTVTGKSTSAETENCKYALGPMTVTGFTMSSITTTESGKGTLSLTFRGHVGPVECHFEGSGKFTYSTESDVIHIEGLALTATSPLCGGSNILFSGAFTMTTAPGDPLRVS